MSRIDNDVMNNSQPKIRMLYSRDDDINLGNICRCNVKWLAFTGLVETGVKDYFDKEIPYIAYLFEGRTIL